jgi:hypothetical protein
MRPKLIGAPELNTGDGHLTRNYGERSQSGNRERWRSITIDRGHGAPPGKSGVHGLTCANPNRNARERSGDRQKIRGRERVEAVGAVAELTGIPCNSM